MEIESDKKMNNDIVQQQPNQFLAFPTKREESNKIVEYFNNIKNKAKEGVDYVASDDFEQKVDKTVATVNKTVTVVGTTATLICALCPLDGPVGEIVSGLATGGVLVAVKAVAEGVKAIYKNSKDIYVATVKDNGESKVDCIVDDNTVQNIDSLKENISKVSQAGKEVGNFVGKSWQQIHTNPNANVTSETLGEMQNEPIY